jgi:predicted PurR-regulated permease PerM
MRLDRKVLFWGLALVTLLALLFIFSSILLPFVVGAAIAYLLDPLAHWFERQGFSRLAATMTILVLFIVVLVALMLLVLPIVINQLILLAENLPSYVGRVDVLIRSILQSSWAQSLGVDADAVRASLTGFLSEGATWLTTVVTGLWSGGLAIINILALLVVTPVVAFYLLYDWDRMIALIDSWIPRDNVDEVRMLAGEIDRVLSGFVRGQALVSLTLGTFYAAGLVLLGVNFGFLIGLMAGIVSFIPYLGSTLGFVISVGVALLQFWPDWVMPLATAALFISGQLIEGYVLQPYMIGTNVGLHPVWLMFALFAFGLLFGFVGLLVAIPIAAAIGVLVRYALARYLASPLYRGSGAAP